MAAVPSWRLATRIHARRRYRGLYTVHRVSAPYRVPRATMHVQYTCTGIRYTPSLSHATPASSVTVKLHSKASYGAYAVHR